MRAYFQSTSVVATTLIRILRGERSVAMAAEYEIEIRKRLGADFLEPVSDDVLLVVVPDCEPKDETICSTYDERVRAAFESFMVEYGFQLCNYDDRVDRDYQPVVSVDEVDTAVQNALSIHGVEERLRHMLTLDLETRLLEEESAHRNTKRALQFSKDVILDTVSEVQKVVSQARASNEKRAQMENLVKMLMVNLLDALAGETGWSIRARHLEAAVDEVLGDPKWKKDIRYSAVDAAIESQDRDDKDI